MSNGSQPTGLSLLQSLHIGDKVTLTGVIDSIGWHYNDPIGLKSIDTASIVVVKKSLHVGAFAICRANMATHNIQGRVVKINAIDSHRGVVDLMFLDDGMFLFAMTLEWFELATTEEVQAAHKQAEKKKQDEADKRFDEEAKTWSNEVLHKRLAKMVALLSEKK